MFERLEAICGVIELTEGMLGLSDAVHGVCRVTVRAARRLWQW